MQFDREKKTAVRTSTFRLGVAQATQHRGRRTITESMRTRHDAGDISAARAVPAEPVENSTPERRRNQAGGNSNTCRKYARYAGSSHIVFSGASETFATGWPLQRTIFITICSGS